MNRTTLSTLAETQPPEPLLEHEIRLRAYDLYEQQGRMDGTAVADWLHAEAEILGKIFSRGAGGARSFRELSLPAMSQFSGILIQSARGGVLLFHEAGVFQRLFAMQTAD